MCLNGYCVYCHFLHGNTASLGKNKFATDKLDMSVHLLIFKFKKIFRKFRQTWSINYLIIYLHWSPESGNHCFHKKFLFRHSSIFPIDSFFNRLLPYFPANPIFMTWFIALFAIILKRVVHAIHDWLPRSTNSYQFNGIDYRLFFKC